MYNAAKSWIDNNTDYSYGFYDNEDCRFLIEKNFDTDVLSAFDRLKVGAFMADLWRYCALYVHGGVYADLDTVSICPLQDLIERDDEFISVTAEVTGGVFNAFICSVPQHNFLARIIDRAVQNILSGNASHPLAITGPLCMGAAINLELGRDKDTEFFAGTYAINGYAFKILEKVHSMDFNNRKVVDAERVILMYKYEGYRSDLRISGQQHWSETEV